MTLGYVMTLKARRAHRPVPDVPHEIQGVRRQILSSPGGNPCSWAWFRKGDDAHAAQASVREMLELAQDDGWTIIAHTTRPIGKQDA